MNGRKRRPARALAIMLSAILIMSSMGLTVFADELNTIIKELSNIHFAIMGGNMTDESENQKRE